MVRLRPGFESRPGRFGPVAQPGKPLQFCIAWELEHTTFNIIKKSSCGREFKEGIISWKVSSGPSYSKIKMSAKKKSVDHELVPEHSKLSEKDAKELLKTYNVTIREFPKILISDPAIAHLKVKEGDIIKISRKSRTAGQIVFYRGVVKD